MRMRIQVVFEPDDEGKEPIVEDIFSLTRDNTADSMIGLSLEESKSIVAAIQQPMVTRQLVEMSKQFRHCDHCGKRQRRNGRDTITYRTLFGNLKLESQRYYHCDCCKHDAKTFSALALILPERTAPEFTYLQSKWATRMSYEETVSSLEEVLPLTTCSSSIHRRTLSTAERLEAEISENRATTIEGTPVDWAELPPPDQRLYVGIDGGFVRHRDEEEQSGRHFEVIVGKTLEKGTDSKRFAFVQTLDDKSKQRVATTLKSHGMQMNSDVTFLTNGADDVRGLPADLHPNADHILDWFHIAMKVTNLKQIAKGIAVEEQVNETLNSLDGVRHRLWHGYVNRAVDAINALLETCDHASAVDDAFCRLHRKLSDFRTYIQNNRDFIPQYADRQQYGEHFSTAFAESAVNEIVSKRMVKKQQMRWSKRGAHLLLQVRVKVLDGDLRGKFETWHSCMAPQAMESNSAMSC